MQFKRIHYLFAGLSFFVALFTYWYTMQPSTPFWDCGEFAAAAAALQVPHPPGSPLWTIVGRIAIMLPTFTDLVARYNFFSVLSSALTILLLYLTTARLIKIWRGEPKTMADALTTFGGGLIAALSYTFTDSFWFNALECEVYAFGSLFIALVPYIMVVWLDHAEEEHNEKYLLLAAYVIGLSLGVHQLALLTIFPAFMLIYYRRRNDKSTVASWFGMVLASSIAFIIAFEVILSKLVEWLGANGIARIFAVALLAGTVYGIYWSQEKRKATINLSLWASLLMFLGYSTYYMIMVRAAQEPPMNQWHADNFATITKFINRDQYGYRPPWPRQAVDPERGEETPTFKNYSGNWDFFWRYQTQHMYNRYLGWNFIGRDSQRQDSGVDWTKTLGIPFFLGLFGLYWHFKRDPNRALTILGAFILFGWMTAWYQNQQDPQPRERDYFYVGAFYLYAMWVGIGAVGVMELLRKKKEENADPENKIPFGVPMGEGNVGLLGGALAALVIAVPLNQAAGLAGMAMGKSFAQTSKWHEYSRSHCNIPFEFAYNTLQSCEPNAILFTAGDNDTFPLWCAQDVYGIRRDVRIINLSLANMSWYIKQLRKDVWHGEGKAVDLPGFNDALLNQPDDSQQGVHLEVNPAKVISVPVSADAMKKFSGDPNAGAGSISWKYRGQFPREDQFIYTVADQIVRSVVEGNISTRPIYFAFGVDPEYQTGLEQNLMLEGMCRRVNPIAPTLPYTFRVNEKAQAEECFQMVKEPVSTFHRGFLLNTFTDPAARWSNDDRTNDAPFYTTQSAYEALAEFYYAKGRAPDAKKALDALDANVPPTRVIYSIANLAGRMSQMYGSVGDKKMADKYAHYALASLEGEYNETLTAATIGTRETAIQSQYADALIEAGQIDKAFAIYDKLRTSTTDQQYRGNIELRWMQLSAMIAERKGDKRGALALYDKIFATFGSSLARSQYEAEFNRIKEHVDSMHRQLGDSIAQLPPSGPAQAPKPGANAPAAGGAQ